MKLEVSKFGKIGPKGFYYLTCVVCSKKVLPSFPKNYNSKLLSDVILKAVISGYDSANVSSAH